MLDNSSASFGPEHPVKNLISGRPLYVQSVTPAICQSHSPPPLRDVCNKRYVIVEGSRTRRMLPLARAIIPNSCELNVMGPDQKPVVAGAAFGEGL